MRSPDLPKVEAETPVNPWLWKMKMLIIDSDYCIFTVEVSSSGWWLSFNQPTLKNMQRSNWIIFPRDLGWKEKNMWVATNQSSIFRHYLSIRVMTSQPISPPPSHLKFSKIKGSFQAAHPRKQKWSTEKKTIWWIPSRKLTYPTWGKGKSSSKCHFWGIC